MVESVLSPELRFTGERGSLSAGCPAVHLQGMPPRSFPGCHCPLHSAQPSRLHVVGLLLGREKAGPQIGRFPKPSGESELDPGGRKPFCVFREEGDMIRVAFPKDHSGSLWRIC